MSEQHPSPVQPPFDTGAYDNMSQVQRQPTFPTSSYLGRPEQRSTHGYALPPIQTTTPLPSGAMQGRTLPPIHLPPVHGPDRMQDVTSKVSIDQLLTQSPAAGPPTSRRPSSRQSSSSPLAYAPPQQAGPNVTYGTAPRQPPPHGYFHQPPLRSSQYVPGQMDPSFQLSAATGHDRLQFSPAANSRSPTTSYCDSEPSPRSSVASSSQPRVSMPPPLDYHLTIRQQPIAARACGFGERDRRVIDPPPILELKITDQKTGRPESDWGAMLALHCTLLSPDGRDDETEIPPAHPDLISTRCLMGTLVASPYQAKDEHGVAGTFFVFPDLSCRTPGRYRLRFKLMRIDPTRMKPGTSSPSVASKVTDVFAVYTAKDFPGMRASSALLKALRRQGLNVGVKKGSEARKGKAKTKKESSSSEDDDSSSDGSEDGRRGSGNTGGSASLGGVSPRSKPSKKKLKKKRRES